MVNPIRESIERDVGLADYIERLIEQAAHTARDREVFRETLIDFGVLCFVRGFDRARESGPESAPRESDVSTHGRKH